MEDEPSFESPKVDVFAALAPISFKLLTFASVFVWKKSDSDYRAELFL